MHRNWFKCWRFTYKRIEFDVNGITIYKIGITHKRKLSKILSRICETLTTMHRMFKGRKMEKFMYYELDKLFVEAYALVLDSFCTRWHNEKHTNIQQSMSLTYPSFGSNILFTCVQIKFNSHRSRVTSTQLWFSKCEAMAGAMNSRSVGNMWMMESEIWLPSSVIRSNRTMRRPTLMAINGIFHSTN